MTPSSPKILLVILLTLISDCSSGILFYVRPRIIHNNLNGDSFTIGFSVNSTDLVLLLNRNREVTSTYKVYSQDDAGNLVASRKATSCQYQGSVIGYPGSNVVLSNCDGLRGKIQFGRSAYHIVPVKETSPDLYHRGSYTDYGVDPVQYTTVLVDKMTQLHTLNSIPVLTEGFTIAHIPPEESSDSVSLKKRRSKRLTSYKLSNEEIMRTNVKKLERRFIKMSLVLDRSLYRTLGSNPQKVADWAERIVNHIANRYKPYNIIPCMVQLEIWNRRNEFTLPDAYTNILKNIGDYRENTLLKKKWSDMTLILTGDKFLRRSVNDSNVVGGAHTNSMCNEVKSIATVTVAGLTDREPYLATLIAHEIGHILGMNHDNAEEEDGGCQCPCKKDDFPSVKDYKVPDYCGEDDRCILESAVNNEYDYFSLCSRRVLEDTSQHWCLFDAPKELDSSRDPLCGNAVVEEGEGCDCGSDQDCPILDPCCEVGTCQLKNTSSCYTGACCTDKCQLQKQGTTCRLKTSGMECDFEETCSGLHSTCPRDTYKQDGRQCQNSNGIQGFCSSKGCMTHRSQCQLVYGNKAYVADELCWKNNAKKVNWLGNCGYTKIGDKTDYNKCEEKDMMCGLLQCKIHKDYLDQAKTQATSKGKVRMNYYDHPNDARYSCLTSMFVQPSDEEDTDLAFIDLGQVSDYTGCGKGLFCYQKQCTYIEPLTCPSINGSECGGHGTCNNLNQCHCDKFWSNDLCVDFDKNSAGSGGYKTIIIILCIAVIIVPIIVGLVVYIVKHKFDLKKMAEDRKAISRGIRRFSTRLSSRARQSTRSDESSRRDCTKTATVTTQYTRVPKIGDSKMVSRPPPPRAMTSKPNSHSLGPVRPPPLVPPKKDEVMKPVVPVRPSPNHSNNSSKNSTPNSSHTKLNGVTGGGPPPVMPPPVPPPQPPSLSKPTLPILRTFKDGLKPGKTDDRPASETFKNVKIPSNLLQNSEKTASDNCLATKKQLQPPKLLAGRSRESKKLQISGPGTNGNLVGLDGRPKSFISATDIIQSSDSIDTVSSTRALFEPSIQKKPPSKWQ